MTRNATPVHLHEDDGLDLIECPECDGEAYFVKWNSPRILICPRCNGTGTIYRHDDDGSDAFDAACDDAHERQIDREAGLP